MIMAIGNFSIENSYVQITKLLTIWHAFPHSFQNHNALSMRNPLPHS